MKNKLRNKRTEIIEIILVSIVVAFGINFISTGIVSLFKLDNSIVIIIIGIIMCLLVIMYYALSVVKSLNIKKIMDGNIVISSNDKRIVGVTEYFASMYMENFLDALLLEDKSVLKAYNKDMKKLDYFCEHYSNIQNSYFKYLMDSLIEYLILDTFVDAKYLSEKNIKILERNNIDKNILDNIFIKVLCEDLEKRKFFHEDMLDSEGELYTITTDDGYIYNKLVVKIPKNARIYKENNNTLIINSKYFRIKIEWGLEDASMANDYNFYNYFLKDDIISWNDFEFGYFVDVDVKYKMPIIFLKKFDEYYLWIDDLIERMYELFDYNECLKQNNWQLLKNIKEYLNK